MSFFNNDDGNANNDGNDNNQNNFNKDDDDNGNDGIYPKKKLTYKSSSSLDTNDDDDNDDGNSDDDGNSNSDIDEDRTTCATSVGSMSFASTIGYTPQRPPSRLTNNNYNTPMSALTIKSQIQTPTPTSGRRGDVLIRRINNSDDSNNTSTTAAATTTTIHDVSQLQRRQRQQLLVLQRLGITTGASFALFIYILIPTTVLVSMLLFGTVLTTFVYNVILYGQNELEYIIRGRGINAYFANNRLVVPDILLDILTRTSIHDILSNPDSPLYPWAVNEHLPYLMLYFIPGLTPEQRDRYITRLSTRHQRLLHSPEGILGYFLNRNNSNNTTTTTGTINNNTANNNSSSNNDSIILRLLIGDEGLREQQHMQQQNQINSIDATTASDTNPPMTMIHEGPIIETIPSGLENDDDDDDDDEEEPTATAQRLQLLQILNPATPTEAISPPPLRQQQQSRSLIPVTIIETVNTSSAISNSQNQQQEQQQQQQQATIDIIPGNLRREGSHSTLSTVARRQYVAEEEEVVLFDAISTAISNYANIASTTIQQSVTESASSVLFGPVYTASIGLTVVGISVAAYGFFVSGTYTMTGDDNTASFFQPTIQLLQTSVRSILTSTLTNIGNSIYGNSSNNGPRSNTNPSMPSSTALIGTTLMSGTTAIVLGLFSHITASSSSPSSSSSSSTSTSPPTSQETGTNTDTTAN